MQALNYALAGLAILLMAYNTFITFKLRGKLIGGEVRVRWNVLSTLVLVFLIGFILSPLLLILDLPIEFLILAVFSVFVLGAVFVLLVVRVVGDILQALDLLEE
ncbi:MAG: hypothetical protein PVF85_02265 [Anaerolineales bacterium]|jgi:uncharacterized membrane protein YvlD (DUF360 family)